MFKDKIKEIISTYENDKDFSYTKPTQKMLSDAQKRLGIKLPNDFLWFLNTYGSGGIQFDIFGVVKDQLEFVEETERYRKLGMPKNLLVIQNCDEWVDCVNADNGVIVKWSQGFGIAETQYGSFCEYFLDELEDSIENLD